MPWEDVTTHHQGTEHTAPCSYGAKRYLATFSRVHGKYSTPTSSAKCGYCLSSSSLSSTSITGAPAAGAGKALGGIILKWRVFNTMCSMFRQQSQAYATDCAKISVMVELLMGRALKWPQAVLNTNPEICYCDFLSKLWCFWQGFQSRHCCSPHVHTQARLEKCG